jgi:hypothetical protein
MDFLSLKSSILVDLESGCWLNNYGVNANTHTFIQHTTKTNP